MSETESNLEEEFKAAVAQFTPQIDAKLAAAAALIAEAEKIAEEQGVPFYAQVSPLGQAYRPKSFDTKWGELDTEAVWKLVNLGDETGWQHSMVCY